MCATVSSPILSYAAIYTYLALQLWKIRDPELNTGNAQSDVIVEQVSYAYISCPQSHEKKQGIHDDELEGTTDIDIFGLPH